MKPRSLFTAGGVAIAVGGIILIITSVTSGKISTFDDCVAAGYPILESYPEQCRTPDGRTFTRDVGNELEKLDLIQASTPRPGDEITSPLVIEGEARGFWFFEASFPARLLDGNGKEISVAVMQAQDEWMTENFVPFRGTLTFPTPSTEKGILVLEKENPSGLPEHADDLRIPIRFKKPTNGETLTVKAFFGNTIFDPDAEDCTKVFPVDREIPKTQAVARAAIEKLIEGPTLNELETEYFTSLPPKVRIQSLSVTNGVAAIDFSRKFEEGVGGSCRVAAIRAQITETLTQFPTVQSVVISIDGRTEDILQP